MKCPFRPITTTEPVGVTKVVESKKFENCYGEECMAYSEIFIPLTKNTLHRCGLVKGDLDGDAT